MTAKKIVFIEGIHGVDKSWVNKISKSIGK